MNASEPDLSFEVPYSCRGLLSVPVSPSGPAFPRAFPYFCGDNRTCWEMGSVLPQHIRKL